MLSLLRGESHILTFSIGWIWTTLLLMELLLPAMFSHHHLSISFVLDEIWQLPRGHRNCVTLTLLNGTFLMCLWDLEAWTGALKSDVLGKSHPVLHRSSLSFKARSSVACKHSTDMERCT